jgi:malonyl-CoA/methylmalonyl-CoA synthetase
VPPDPHLAGGVPVGAAGLLAGGSLPAVWAARWAAAPSAEALWFGGPAPWCSAGELDGHTRQVAARLAALGVSAGDRVVWSAEPTAASVAACLGALRLGAVVVPVNPAAAERELVHVVGDVRPRVVFAERPQHARWLAGAAAGLRVVTAGWEALDGLGGVPPADAPEPAGLDRAAPDAPALVVYTSGTTGTPKGAVLSHANLLAGVRALQLAWRWDADDRLVLTLPLFHVHGLCVGLFGTLAAGGSAIVQERFGANAVADAARDDGATLFFGVPTMYHRFVTSHRLPELSRFRLCVSGSAPLAPSLWRQIREDAGVAVLERYGMTETMLTLSNPYDGERRPGTVGFPLPGVEVRVAPDAPGHGDGEGGATGGGELCVRGPSVFGGYWEHPAATAAAFDDGWFRTGDTASVDGDGYYSILGRRGDLIISGGFNVYPAEVEDVLLRHPSVADVAVVGTPSDEWGEAVTAWVVPAGEGFSEEALLEFASTHLAPYKRPRAVRVVGSLPRNAMGKVRRGELR